MQSFDLFCRFARLFSCVGGGGVNGLGQLHSLRTGSSHHVQMNVLLPGIKALQR